MFTEGSDFYPPLENHVTFSAGSDKGDSYCFTYTIVNSECVEYDEHFSVELTSKDDYVKFHISYAYIYIIDNDSKCLVPDFYRVHS